MKRKARWVWVELPSGGRVKVRSDVQPQTISALDELMRAVAAQYAAKEEPESMTTMNEFTTLDQIVEQLRLCGYECPAGALEDNAAFQALESMSGVVDSLLSGREEVITLHILRNWPREQTRRFALHLLGSETDEAANQ